VTWIRSAQPGPVLAADPAAPPEPVDAARLLAVRPSARTLLHRLAWPGRLVLAAASGLLLCLAFPGTGWWPLAPVAVAGLTLATRGRGAGTGAAAGLVFGFGFLVIHLNWAGEYVGAFPWLALAGFEALFLAALGALVPYIWRLPGPAPTRIPLQIVAVGGLWVAQEALRGRQPFGGLPWGRLAFSQANGPFVGLAALGGAPLVSFAVAAAGGALAVGVAAVLPGRHAPPVRTLSAGLAVALALPALGLAVPLPASGGGRSVEVGAVQGNVPRLGLEFNAERRQVLDNHAEATERYAAQVAAGRLPQPDLVLWPENASDVDPLRNADARQVIDSAVTDIGVPVLVGAVLREPEGMLSNVGIVWQPLGAARPGPGDRYVKRHPVPFGEYIPHRQFFRRISKQVDLVRRDFVAGDRVGVLPMGPARVGDVICFEVAYDSLVRDPVRAGADLLVVQTNNATFGFSDENVQQLAISRLRAVETGRAIVHVSTVGISALIEPDGSLLAESSFFVPQTLHGRLPLRTEQTPATRIGAAPEVVLAGLGLLLGALGVLTRRRVVATARRDGDPQPVRRGHSAKIGGWTAARGRGKGRMSR
jgi:apolipoprotein N-acyltransferase